MPDGGMAARALVRSPRPPRRPASTMRFDTTVDRIVVANGYPTAECAASVVGDRRSLVRADVVVCNAEPAVVYRTVVAEPSGTESGATQAPTRRRRWCGTPV